MGVRVKIGSLCSGYGGLDMAVEAYFNAETVWMCDNDKYASIVIKERWGLPNLGNLKEVDWKTVEPIDILTAGYPCQPFSQAGQRKGVNDERHIWPNIKQIISQLRPNIVILENVRGHLSLGFKEVLKDLTEIGYDAQWSIVRASDVGAPHQRARLFVIAYPIDYRQSQGNGLRSQQAFPQSTNNGCIANANSNAYEESQRVNLRLQTKGRRLEDGQNKGKARDEHRFSLQMDRQEVPNALDQGRLSAKFVEYMMGLPTGWVTDCQLSNNNQLKLLGNGVVPQQAYEAIRTLMSIVNDIYPIYRTIDDQIDNWESIGVDGKYGSEQHLC
jgi:DNA (cytosine-5)-methyltransferase 1